MSVTREREYKEHQRRANDPDYCHCKSIVQLEGKLELFKLNVDHLGLTLNNHKEEMSNFFTEIKLELRECMTSINESSTKLRLGADRFENIEINAQETKQNLYTHAYGKDGQHSKVRADYTKDRLYLWAAFGVCFVTLVSTEHGNQVIDTFKKLIF